MNLKYIYEKKVNGVSYLQVKVPGKDSKSFGPKDYKNYKEQLNAAVNYRNEVLTEHKVEAKEKSAYTVAYAFSRSNKLLKVSLNTEKKNVYKFNKYFSDFHSTPLSEIKARDLIEFYNSLLDEVSLNNMQKLAYIWKRIFKAGIIDEAITTNFADVVPVPVSKAVQKPLNHETNLETVNMMINAINSRMKYSKADAYNHGLIVFVIKIILYTGLRPSECYALTKEDIDFNKNVIHINKRVGSDYKQMYTLVTPKTANAVRDIPICDELKPILEDLLNYSRNDILFTLYNGKLMSTQYTGAFINHVAHDLGVDFHLYQLRHLFSVEVGKVANTRTLMELMGHANAAMSIYYQYSSKEEKIEALNKRSEMLS